LHAFFIYLQKLDKRELSKYTLYGVIVHTGGLTGGHYYAYVKRLESDKWELCDDSYVRRVDDKDVLGSEAYILFYQKVEQSFPV
jgi:ubiquitin carboxyl-terminal hydrolase 4/11/15